MPGFPRPKRTGFSTPTQHPVTTGEEVSYADSTIWNLPCAKHRRHEEAARTGTPGRYAWTRPARYTGSPLRFAVLRLHEPDLGATGRDHAVTHFPERGQPPAASSRPAGQECRLAGHVEWRALRTGAWCWSLLGRDRGDGRAPAYARRGNPGAGGGYRDHASHLERARQPAL